MAVIPDDLAEVVRRAAAGTADYPADPSGIERRWRRRRRRRAIAGAAALAALSLAAVPVVDAALGTDPPPEVAAPPAQHQRLMVAGKVASMMARDVTNGKVVSRRGAVEVLPDGTVKRWPLPDRDVRYQVLGLPDDRLVTLEYAAPPDESGPAAYTLRVVSPTGATESETELGSDDTALGAATADTVYLWRPEGIVGYPLGGGAHRVVLPASDLGPHQPRDIDLLGDRLVVLGGSAEPCRVRIFNLPAGTSSPASLSEQGCEDAGSVRISPDGKLVAIGYQRSNAPRVSVLDIDTGAPVFDTSVEAPGGGPASWRGMAWLDGTHLRLAVAIPPSDPDRTYYEEDLIRQQIIEVG